MTPIQAYMKKNEKIVFSNPRNKREKPKPKYQLGQLVRTADNKRVHSKSDTTTWSCNLYTINEVLHDTISSYRVDCVPGRYNEILSNPQIYLLMKKNQVIRKSNLIQ